MGLSIHYNGRFNPAASLQEMITEVADIAATYQWPFHIYEDRFPSTVFGDTYNDEVYGIHITPPGSETLWLCFLSNGRMSSPVHLQFYGNTNDSENEQMLYALATKTQYAGIEIHILIVKLLKHISKKYFLDFELIDEGKYWETGDEKLLAEIFARYNAILGLVSNALDNFPRHAGESFDNYFERVLKGIEKK
ncbi:MAG: hypothetical protein JWQ30_1546 [Sediminibacterium sp.]|nr:hypothetical protein [Sediminibacterium sp.]